MSSKNDLLKSLRSINIAGSLFGLSPNIITTNGEIITNFRTKLVVFIILVAQLSMQWYAKQDNSKLYRESLLKIVVVTQIVAWRCFPTVYLILQYLDRKKNKKLLNKLNRINKELIVFMFAHKGRKFNDRYIKLIFLLFVITFVFSAILGATLDYMNHHSQFYAMKYLIYVYAYFLFDFTLPMFILKFVILNCLIRERIQAINDVLEKNQTGGEKVSKIHE